MWYVETLLAGQNVLEIGHCNHINGMGQSILEALQLYTAGRTKCQPQDDKIMIGNRGTCVDGSTQNRDIDATSGSGNY